MKQPDGRRAPDTEILEAVRDLRFADQAMVASINSPRGSKGAIASQEKAIRRVVQLVTGRTPTAALCEIVDEEYTS